MEVVVVRRQNLRARIFTSFHEEPEELLKNEERDKIGKQPGQFINTDTEISKVKVRK